MQPDGCVEYLGRKDAQVKLRGARVEVEALESALLSLPQLREAVVQVREDRPDEPCLVAYLVAGPEPTTVSALRSALAQTLAGTTLPTHYVFLEALPLNENGKVDRRHLPPPDGRRPALDAPFVAPRTPVEQEVAEIWSALLGVSPIGVHDSFLDLGGHSLLATQVTSRMCALFGIELPLRAFLEASTVAELALLVLQQLVERTASAPVELLLERLESA
jgi:acyl carrier protein